MYEEIACVDEKYVSLNLYETCRQLGEAHNSEWARNWANWTIYFRVTSSKAPHMLIFDILLVLTHSVSKLY